MALGKNWRETECEWKLCSAKCSLRKETKGVFKGQEIITHANGVREYFKNGQPGHTDWGSDSTKHIVLKPGRKSKYWCGACEHEPCRCDDCPKCGHDCRCDDCPKCGHDPCRCDECIMCDQDPCRCDDCPKCSHNPCRCDECTKCGHETCRCGEGEAPMDRKPTKRKAAPPKKASKKKKAAPKKPSKKKAPPAKKAKK